MATVEDDEVQLQSAQREVPTIEVPKIEVPKIEDYEFHVQAELLVKQFGADYAASIINQAKVLAFTERANEVQSVHVEHARDLIFERQMKPESQGKSLGRELLLFVGGAVLGAGVHGFPSDLSAGNKMLTVTWFIFCLVGLALAFFGLLLGIRRE